MNLNLDTLKKEILDYMDGNGFIVYHGTPSAEDVAAVPWDSDGHPDYRMFLDVARKLDAKPILTFVRDFDEEEIDDLMEQLEAAELPRDERRALEQRIKSFRQYLGTTCFIELSFNFEGSFYAYSLEAPWMEEFLALELELDHDEVEEDTGDDPSLGGYFSKN